MLNFFVIKGQWRNYVRHRSRATRLIVMAMSLKLGRILGIDVYIHATFWLLLAFVGFSDYSRTHDVMGAVAGMVFILALFVCVVLHEYGHALTARRYGIQTRDITVLPIGGLARLERMPSDPRQELVVALAGPAVNVIIALLLGIYLAATGGFVQSAESAVVSGGFVQRLFSVNIMLVVFNLLPAFPMDGGRVLRAVLAMRMPYNRATQIAANIGQTMAFLFAIVGFMTGAITLLLIAFFVWTGAAQEANATQARTAFAGVPVASAMITEFHAVSPHDTLGLMTQMILHSAQQDFPVLDGQGELVGLLTRADFLKGLTEFGENATVARAMRTEFQTVDAGQMLEPVLSRLSEGDCHTAPVVRQGRLAGLLTMDNVGEYLMIHSALQSRRTRVSAAQI